MFGLAETRVLRLRLGATLDFRNVAPLRSDYGTSSKAVVSDDEPALVSAEAVGDPEGAENSVRRLRARESMRVGRIIR